MGEIGIMVSRLQQEGFDLEDMIDDELRAAGFLELCERYNFRHVMVFLHSGVVNLDITSNLRLLGHSLLFDSC